MSLLKNKKIIKILTIIIGIILSIFLVFDLTESYLFAETHIDVEEFDNHLELKVDVGFSAGWFRSYSLYEKEEGIYILKVKGTPWEFRGKIWPQTIRLDKSPDEVKAIEFTDGKESRIIYPNYMELKKLPKSSVAFIVSFNFPTSYNS